MATEDLTHGDVTSSLVRFALPMIAGNLLQQAYSLTDTYIVGRYVGADALAAVGGTGARRVGGAGYLDPTSARAAADSSPTYQ